MNNIQNAFMRQAAVLEPFGFCESEVLELLKKCRLYSDTKNLREKCEENSLKLLSSKEFVINDSLTTVVSVFDKS